MEFVGDVLLVLGLDEIRFLCKKRPPLIENLTEEQFQEGHAGIDLRVGSFYKLRKGSVLLGIEGERDTTGSIPQQILSHKNNGRNVPFVLKPKQFVLAETIEKLNMPNNLIGFVWPRSTLSTFGIILHAGPIHPNYQGGLILGMYNSGPCDFCIKIGSRFLNITFEKIIGKANPYSSRDKVEKVKSGIYEASRRNSRNNQKQNS